jgi:hypothetical protein
VTGVALTGVLGGGTAGALGTFFIMSKLKIAIVSLVIAGGLATGVIEVRTNRALRAEMATGTDDSVRLPQENERLRAAVAKLGEHNPEVDELTKLRARISALKARPDGIVDAELRPPRNVGRATPAAAIETFCWAALQGDLDFAGSFMTFSDDTPENREAFMANFSAAVRDRYRTPERLCVAALFGVGYLGNPDPVAAMQVVSVDEEHGPEQMKIKMWLRTVSGREAGGGDTYNLGAAGWARKPIPLLQPKILQGLRERLDPVTGDFVPPKQLVSESGS